MNGRTLKTLSLATTALLFAAAAMAQPRRGPGMGMPRYDKTTETTLHGTVEEVQSHQGRVGGTGTHLLLKTDDGTVDVHLGPTNWLTDRKYEFAKGDHLQVLGSKVTIDGADAFIAREITKGDAKIVLRDENGIPEWAGGRRGTPPPNRD